MYLVFEEVTGISESDGKVFPGLSMKAPGDDGTVIFNSDDLFADSSGSGLSAADLKTQVSASLSFTSGVIKNPVHITVGNVLTLNSANTKIVRTPQIRIFYRKDFGDWYKYLGMLSTSTIDGTLYEVDLRKDEK